MLCVVNVVEGINGKSGANLFTNAGWNFFFEMQFTDQLHEIKYFASLGMLGIFPEFEFNRGKIIGVGQR